MDELPRDFDMIVIGTGMAESIVAAAASRVGKKVLHLDTSDYYGGLWASFNLEAMQGFLDKAMGTTERTLNGIFNVECNWHVESTSEPEVKETKAVQTISGSSQIEPSIEAVEEAVEKTIDPVNQPDVEESKYWSKDGVLKEYRKFNIDLAPKLLYARGELVELLISSNIARYAEFRCVNRVLTWINDSLQPVPCSRADVFATKNVTVVEKRMLMKLLTSFMEFDGKNPSEEWKGFENKTLLEYLKSKKLTANLIHYVLYAIAEASDTTPCYDGVESCKRFLVSLGRYGNTPFLWSMYGCGELPQCFCRLCAVFGGVYCLNREIESINVNENAEDKGKSVTVHSKGSELYCEHLIIGVDKVPSHLIKNVDFVLGISRGVFVTNKSILEECEREPLTLLRFPPLNGSGDPVTVIELGPSTSSCPKGSYLVHMICSQKETAKVDLQQYAEKLFSFEKQSVSLEQGDILLNKPNVLWSCFFNMVDTSDNQKIESTFENVHIMTGPDMDLDFDHAVRQGREIFLSMYPDEQFLPRAPDPDEIVFEGEDALAGPEFQTDESNNDQNESESKLMEIQTNEDVLKDEINAEKAEEEAYQTVHSDSN